MDFRE
jgi:hypothetical protein